MIWLPESEIGWYPVKAQPYDASYWDNYRHLDNTETGRKLTAARIDLVKSYWNGPVVDIGIGGGRFLTDRPQTLGYDINPSAVDWLIERHRWCNPYMTKVAAVSFWDSLEHIHDPRPLLDNVTDYVFCSLPLFTSVEHVLRSRHFKKEEHCWYFTANGLRSFMHRCGFKMMYMDTREVAAGREDIGSFVFKRDQ